MAFVDLQAFFDSIWKDGLLWLLWQAGVRGRAFLCVASLFAASSACAVVGGQRSGSWACTVGVVQGSVLAPLLAALFLTALVAGIEAAGGGARWLDSSGDCHRTHSLWYVDDGALLAESAAALQRMLDAASRWASRWGMDFRFGIEKTAVLCSAGVAAARAQPVFLAGPGGRRIQLPIVWRYPYLGIPLAAGVAASHVVPAIRRIGRTRTWAVVGFAAQAGLSVNAAVLVWREHAFAAVQFLLPFVSFSAEAFRALCNAQSPWGRALLGWPAHAPFLAVIGELGWPLAPFWALAGRIALLSRCMAPRPGGAAENLRHIIVAASVAPASWAHTAFAAAKALQGGPLPPAGAVAWRELSSQLKSAVERCAMAVWVDAVHRNAELVAYAPLALYATGRRGRPDSVQMKGPAWLRADAARIFGLARAGVPFFGPPAPSPCPACGSPCAADVSHCLRFCSAAKGARQAWLHAVPAAHAAAFNSADRQVALVAVFCSDRPVSQVWAAVRFVAEACASCRAASDSRV